MQLNAEILLGILADRFYQVLGLLQHVVGIVVERVILEQFSRRPLARVEVFAYPFQVGDGLVGVVVESRILTLAKGDRKSTRLNSSHT